MRVLRWAGRLRRATSDDRIEAKDDHHLQRTQKEGLATELFDRVQAARGTRYRGHHSGRDRGGDHAELIAKRRNVERKLPT